MRKHATVTWFYSWRRSRSHQQSTERLHRPTQDIFFPPTTNAAHYDEEDRKWQTAGIALDFLLCTVMFTSCLVHVCTLWFVAKAFFLGPLLFMSVHTVHILISIWMFRIFTAFIERSTCCSFQMSVLLTVILPTLFAFHIILLLI